MDARTLQKKIERALRPVGFERAGRSLRRAGAGVTTLVGLEVGFGKQRFVNVGFWINALGPAPEAIEKTHLYFRLERLVPALRELVLAAGALDDPDQPRACEELCRLLPTQVDAALRGLATEDGRRSA